ncbi:hypothetical protein ACTXT7_003601 [Hymenolepis weldensis]
MLKSLSAEIKALPLKNEAKISLDISNASTTSISLNSSGNSFQSPVVLVFSQVLPTETLVQAVNDEIAPISRRRCIIDESCTPYEIFHAQNRASTTCLQAYRAQAAISPKILSA